MAFIVKRDTAIPVNYCSEKAGVALSAPGKPDMRRD